MRLLLSCALPRSRSIPKFNQKCIVAGDTQVHWRLVEVGPTAAVRVDGLNALIFLDVERIFFRCCATGAAASSSTHRDLEWLQHIRTTGSILEGALIGCTHVDDTHRSTRNTCTYARIHTRARTQTHMHMVLVEEEEEEEKNKKCIVSLIAQFLKLDAEAG